jgi:hypothetical protein
LPRVQERERIRVEKAKKLVKFNDLLIEMATLKNRRRLGQTRKNIKKNILGKPLIVCNKTKVTGFYRNGYCSTGNNNAGTHVVCAVMDNDFLQYTLKQGNDLITPRPGFPGLVAGDKWCVCALRWLEAYKAGKAPRVKLESTDSRALQYINRKILFEKKV